MKKYQLVVFLVILSSLSISISKAQCRNGKINGAHCCGAHIDDNKNGICDYSEVKSLDTIKQKSTKNSTVKKEATSASETKNRCEGCSETKCIHSESNNTVESADDDEFKTMDATEVDTNTISAKELEAATKEKEKPYSLILISLISIGLYASTWLLVKLKKMKLALHRKIWNVVLLLTFLVSCLFGFFLVIQLNYDFVIDWYKTLLYWHVQVGIGMTIIALFHTIWHTKYYVNMLKRK